MFAQKRHRKIDSSSNCLDSGFVPELSSKKKRDTEPAEENDIPAESACPSGAKYIQLWPIPMTMTTEQIFRYFQAYYGHVEYVGFHTIAGINFATVTFGNEECATKATLQKQHTIVGKIVNVLIATQFQQQSGLLALNDDCFLEIFKYLELKDLCSIADVCTRLKAIAKRHFSSKYKEETFTIKEEAATVKSCLQNFCSEMQSIRIVRISKSLLCGINILRLLQIYCGSLLCLEMEKIHFRFHSGSSTEMLAPLMLRLHKLILTNANISDKFSSIFDVDELILTGIQIMENNEDNTKQPQPQFSRLKKIQIRQHYQNPTALLCHLNQSKSLKHMEISCFHADASFFDETSKFENLRTLILLVRLNYTIEDLNDMVKRLIHLSDLVFNVVFRMIYGPANLLQLIQNGKNLRKLMVIFYKYRLNSLDTTNMQQISDIVADRRIDVILIGNENQIRPFNVTFPTETPPKITCLLMGTIQSILSRFFYHSTPSY